MSAKRLFKKYRDIFESYGDEATRVTFGGELNYEAGKLFFTVFIALVVWLPYIPYDLRLHQFPVFAVGVRIAFCAISAALIILKLTPRFRNRPDILLMTLIASLYILTAVVTASAGIATPAYIGGLTLVIMLPVFMPFTLNYKMALTAVSVSLFFITGALTELDYSNVSIRYALNDLAVSLLLSFIMSYALNVIRLRSWKHRQKLDKVILDNEKSLATIFSLAKKAEASDHAKSAFLATMSHEIRTPMNAILGIAQISMHDGDTPDKCVAAFEKINVSGNVLLDIINDILDMSKIETGKMELNPIEYDVASLINDAATLNSVRIGSKPIEFILEADENLPSKLRGDELRIKQILNNLLSNAVKYTEQGYVKLTISHTAHTGGIKLIIAVEDTGQGLKPEDCERLFLEEYVRFNTETNRSAEGTGLGLNITRRLVELMNGEISVKSEYGKGSVFTVTLEQQLCDGSPIGAQTAANLRSASYASRRLEERGRVTRSPMPYGSVLVVDDVESNLYVAKGLLTLYGLRIKTADSGYEALKIIERGETFDIIFMDHMMPKMDGIETTRKIRELGYGGVIVALTANALVGNEETFRGSGFDGFIAKPIDMLKLNDVLNSFIRDRRTEEADKYVPETSEHVDNAVVSPELARVFARAARKALTTLRETIPACAEAAGAAPGLAATAGDINLFTTTVHGIKPALASINENEAAQAALDLEKAGLSGDIGFIRANAPRFIETLENITEKLLDIAESADDAADATVTEDTELLTERLAELITACEDYDDAAALAALDTLKDKEWQKETSEALASIRDAIYIDSDFDGAAQRARELSDVGSGRRTF